jgi:oxygen-dependent protoporphyrinogen oxidase
MSTIVIGGGLAGLTAGWLLAERGEDVLVLEGAARVGGKLRLAEVAGVPADVGAEAMLNRRPEGVDVARALGLPIEHPATSGSGLVLGGRVVPLPRSLMGVPFDVESLRGVVPDLERVAAERDLAPSDLTQDRAVGDVLAERFGDDLVDLLVEPLLGGVYAGHARELSIRATTPQLVALAERGSLLDAAAALPTSDAPVFAGVTGGMGTLPAALASRVQHRTDAVARELRGAGDGWDVTLGSTRSPEVLHADRVVVAVPAAPAARLLSEVAPEAADHLAAIESASMAVVTHAFRAADLGAFTDVAATGFLVPPREGRAIKAATYSFAKWGWVRAAGDGLCLLRTSTGRHREERTLQVDDDTLVADSLRELAALAGIEATPVDSHVQRWGGGLPQYAVGHLDRVAAIRADLPPGITVCGAAYDGVGIPAVIASARRATMAV